MSSMPVRDARDAFEKAYFEYHLAREGSAYLGRTYDLMGQALN